MCLNLKKDKHIEKLEEELSDLKKKAALTNTNGDTALKEYFSTINKWELDSLPKSEKADGTFVRKCLEFVYADELHRLPQKTLTGRSSQHANCDPMSPEKVVYIERKFSERIFGQENYIQRKKKFRKTVSNALQTIRNKLLD